jgi:hypothetical protein
MLACLSGRVKRPKSRFLTENRFCAKIVFGPKSFLPRGGFKIVFAAGRKMSLPSELSPIRELRVAGDQ